MQNGDREIWFRITIKIRKKRRSHNVHIFYRVIHIEVLFYIPRARAQPLERIGKSFRLQLDLIRSDFDRSKFIL